MATELKGNTRRAAFKQLDVERALGGARAAGFDVGEIIISPSTGEIRLLAMGRANHSEADVDDEIAALFGR